MHYYTHNIGDFAMETRGLDYEEIGIYITLIDRYASTQKPLSSSWVALAYKGESNCKALALLEAFFVQTNEGWTHPRIDELIEKFEETSEKRRVAGARGGKKKRVSATATEELINETSAKQMLSNCSLTNNQEPITNTQDIEASTPAKAPRRKASSACPFLPGAEIPDDYREVAEKAGIGDPQKVFEKFVNHALSTDRRLVDWKAGFRTWCANELQFHPNQKPAQKPLAQRTAADYEDWLS